MKFDHRVKVNGKWYNAGEEINTSPVNAVSKTEKENVENQNKTTLKRTDIQKMKVEELKELATSLGIEFNDETNGTQLKKEIFIKLGM